MTSFWRLHPGLCRTGIALACLVATIWALTQYGSNDSQLTLSMLISLCGPTR
jgi:hypothetical protein